MEKKIKIKTKKNLALAISLIGVFILWTLLLQFVDVQSIGPQGSSVGFATLNGFVRDIVGSNLLLYIITDWLGLVPIAVAFGFAIFGVAQLIKRKSLLRVDFSIIVLGIFYIAVIFVYILFEFVVINYRPILINGYLEVSYPSSTTMLVMTVIPTAIMQFNLRIKNKIFKRTLIAIMVFFIAFMVIGRIISGVHWISDIIGGALISSGLVMCYYFFLSNDNFKFNKRE